MKEIKDLDFGFNDAENYKRPENKAMFDKFFFRTDEFQNLFKGSKYFLIGEKGTGKTAYSTYVLNNFTFNTNGFLNYIRETDYQKFIKLKKDNHLQLSDYTNIWKVLVYLLLANRIKEKEQENSPFKSSDKFNAIENAINEYFINAFSPEIIHALNLVEKTKQSAKLVSKYFEILGEQVKEDSFTHSKFQTNLLYIQNHFESALGSIKLKFNYILFIDGIDVRPENVEYEEYLDCIKGLANAAWSLNNDFFPNIKSEGKIKVVLLIRPDIFNNLGLQNQNNKIKDNSVLLDWRTTYLEYDNSKLFMLADRLLSSQQDKFYPLGECWDFYFPYKVRNGRRVDHSFISFLRQSFYRPRDIVTMLDLLKEIHVRNKKSDRFKFSEKDFNNAEFQTRYSDYLLGEIKDYLSFYYSDKDYELFLKFFDYLEGKQDFNFAYYTVAFKKYEEYFFRNQIEKPKFFETSETFLQFLYDLNIICYIEKSRAGEFTRWCFRERNYSNLSPKVKSGCSYKIHIGLAKGLNLGKRTFRTSS